MKNKIIINIWAIALFIYTPAHSEIYKCTDGNSVSYQSDPCPEEEQKDTNSSSAFDGWEFGMHIPAMKQEARKRKLAISPGNTAIISTFNEKHLASKPKAREYTYKTKIMDKFTTVTLFFTKTTEELYKIRATFHVIQLKPEERKYFYKSLYTQLSKKYGTSKNIQTDTAKQNAKNNPLGSFLTRGVSDALIGTLQAWGLNTDNVVTLSYKKNYHTMTSYQLTYKYIPLIEQNKKEVTHSIKERTNKAMVEDAGRL